MVNTNDPEFKKRLSSWDDEVHGKWVEVKKIPSRSDAGHLNKFLKRLSKMLMPLPDMDDLNAESVARLFKLNAKNAAKLKLDMSIMHDHFTLKSPPPVTTPVTAGSTSGIGR